MSLTLLVSMMLAFAFSISVAVAIGGSSMLGLAIFESGKLVLAPKEMFAAIDKFPLAAVPFFILAGNLMNVAGITSRIYGFATALVGWMRGGLGQVNIVGSVVFSGMSGTAIADAAVSIPRAVAAPAALLLAAAPALGPSISGLILDSLSWRWVTSRT